MIFKNDKVYNALKWLVLVFTNLFISFLTGLGTLYHFDTTIINGTIALVATFIGGLIGVSGVKYQKEQNKPTSGDENGME